MLPDRVVFSFFNCRSIAFLVFLDSIPWLYWLFSCAGYNIAHVLFQIVSRTLGIFERNSAMNKLTDIDEGAIRRVDWQSLVPPTLFFRAFSATFKFSFIALGAILIAIAASLLGLRGSDVYPHFNGCEASTALAATEPICHGEGAVVSVLAPIQYQFRLDVAPNSLMSGRWNCDRCGSSFASGIRFLPTMILGCVLFALFALALSRTTLVRLLTTSRSSLIASFSFALRRLPSLITPVLTPFFFLVILIVLGMIGSFDVLRFAAPVVALISFVALFLCVTTSLSAPLAVSAVAAENCDGFDATSRGISYLTQRPLFWFLYMVLALILTCVGLVFFEAISWITLAFFDSVYASSEGWVDFWRLVLIATPDSYVIVALVVYTNAIYALLRRSVDGTPYDSCELNLGQTKSKKLRKILQDGKGAPTFDSENARRERMNSESELSDQSE